MSASDPSLIQPHLANGLEGISSLQICLRGPTQLLWTEALLLHTFISKWKCSGPGGHTVKSFWALKLACLESQWRMQASQTSGIFRAALGKILL